MKTMTMTCPACKDYPSTGRTEPGPKPPNFKVGKRVPVYVQQPAEYVCATCNRVLDSFPVWFPYLEPMISRVPLSKKIMESILKKEKENG